MAGIPNPKAARVVSERAAAGVPRELVFVISADYERRTGGWIYDTRLMRELERCGWRVHEFILPAGFPHPDAQARAQSAAAFAGLPDGALVVADQLCLGVLPEVAEREAERLRLVMIVHHPLALEENGTSDSDPVARSEREALRHVRLAVVTSHETARYLCEQFGMPTARIAVAVPGTDPRPLAPGSGARMLSLLSVGAVVPRKDHGTLIAALSGLSAEPWRLTIAGNTTRAPDHVAMIRSQIESCGLADRVSLAGELDDAALAAAWHNADIYVAASRHEGFGMAIAEAISRGLPIVTTQAGTVSEWLSSHAALIVPAGDPVSLRVALGGVLRQPEIRLALRRGASEQRLRLPRWRETAGHVDAALAGVVAGSVSFRHPD